MTLSGIFCMTVNNIFILCYTISIYYYCKLFKKSFFSTNKRAILVKPVKVNLIGKTFLPIPCDPLTFVKKKKIKNLKYSTNI